MEESVRMTEDIDKWRKCVHGVATLGSRTAKEHNAVAYPRYSPIRGNLACSAASSFYMVSVFTVTPWFYTVVRYDILYFNVRSKPT